MYFMYFIQRCILCHPSDSTVSEDAGIEPRTLATLALAVRRSYNLGPNLIQLLFWRFCISAVSEWVLCKVCSVNF
jgi:hypothetical protein